MNSVDGQEQCLLPSHFASRRCEPSRVEMNPYLLPEPAVRSTDESCVVALGAGVSWKTVRARVKGFETLLALHVYHSLRNDIRSGLSGAR